MKILKLDKLSDFSDWNTLESSVDLSYPWQLKEYPSTSFKAYYDEAYLYFQFYAHGPDPLVYVNDNHKLEVRHSERVEIFFRGDETMKPYYCLEMDPHGRVLDYRADYYRVFDREWSWPDDLELVILQEEGHYTLSGKLRLTTLEKLGLLKDKQLEVGLYRGHCTEIINEQGIIKWSTWIDPKTDEPDFHVPGSFGVIQLT